MRRSRPLARITPFVVMALVIGLIAVPATPANADTCRQLRLTLVMDWPSDVTVTGNWGSYSAELAKTTSSPPYIYRGDVIVPLSAYAAAWSYRISIGPHVVFDSGASLDPVSLGVDSCSQELVAYRAASGDVTVRTFRDPTGSGAVGPFDAPFYPGIGVPVHICQLALTNRGCVPGSEALLGSPVTTTADTDFTVGWGRLLGRFKVWVDAPEQHVRTYPRSGSSVLDCGAIVNICSAQQGQWIVELRGGGSVWLDIGLIGPVSNDDQ